VFFIFALTSFFNSGTFLAPFFLGKITLVIVALILAIINLGTSKEYLLWFYFLASLVFALTDEFTVNFLDQYFTTTYFDDLSSSLIFLCVTFIIYFGFHLGAILLFYFSAKQKLISLILVSLLFLSIFLIFSDRTIDGTISLSVYFLLYFINGQRDSQLKNKTLRVISYQYLLIVLLGSFEYFI
jgi:hypothetical protein